MGASFKKRGAIGKLNENGATAAAMNLVSQSHARTCVALWERRFARLGVDLMSIPGQRFSRFLKEVPMIGTLVHQFCNQVVSSDGRNR